MKFQNGLDDYSQNKFRWGFLNYFGKMLQLLFNEAIITETLKIILKPTNWIRI